MGTRSTCLPAAVQQPCDGCSGVGKQRHGVVRVPHDGKAVVAQEVVVAMGPVVQEQLHEYQGVRSHAIFFCAGHQP